ncbi:DM13 domain-containing protein [Bauldia litoralis]|uniref:DM13 domain-containing protein n=1 Tax=Bauldia litoralis TaxID=665467 RepID=UPI003265BB11
MAATRGGRIWRAIAIFLFGGILGTAFGVAVGLFIFPYVFPPPPATETIASEDTEALVATGEFIHADPSDPVHYGSGKVSVYEKAVFLEPDFEVGPGPAYHVYLVPKERVRVSGDVRDTMYVDLGQLRAFKGSQRYPIPDGVDIADYPSVVIWCETFSVLISPADVTAVEETSLLHSSGSDSASASKVLPKNENPG